MSVLWGTASSNDIQRSTILSLSVLKRKTHALSRSIPLMLSVQFAMTCSNYGLGFDNKCLSKHFSDVPPVEPPFPWKSSPLLVLVALGFDVCGRLVAGHKNICCRVVVASSLDEVCCQVLRTPA